MAEKAFEVIPLVTVYQFTAIALNLRKPYFCDEFYQHTFLLFTGYCKYFLVYIFLGLLSPNIDWYFANL